MYRLADCKHRLMIRNQMNASIHFQKFALEPTVLNHKGAMDFNAKACHPGHLFAIPRLKLSSLIAQGLIYVRRFSR